MTEEQLVNAYYDCAKYWAMNPLTFIDEPISELLLLIAQANRIEKAR